MCSPGCRTGQRQSVEHRQRLSGVEPRTCAVNRCLEVRKGRLLGVFRAQQLVVALNQAQVREVLVEGQAGQERHEHDVAVPTHGARPDRAVLLGVEVKSCSTDHVSPTGPRFREPHASKLCRIWWT
jgi:hypothetical protein